MLFASGRSAVHRGRRERKARGGGRRRAGRLACAHRLAMLGTTVTVFEAKSKLGGLNEYGVAAYKVADDFAQARGGIRAVARRHRGAMREGLGRDVTLTQLRRDFDAVFLASGSAA
jgi:glutamate synthase (NADPH/NADH) small chain